MVPELVEGDGAKTFFLRRTFRFAKRRRKGVGLFNSLRQAQGPLFSALVNMALRQVQQPLKST